ncbi:MAG: P-loop NTPase fold protein [Candidatus Taylorbacteria bacterium]|nr:P-loop NTPase fold protein [Candidatus Taylorbacteria bacterium]
MEDSRTPFVKEVAKTITERHGNESGSFIFGISGKWGEGKTRFLDELRKTLETGGSSFIVVDINPWKFSVDRISFLRNFLRTLYKKCDSENENGLRELDVDTSVNSIDWELFVKFVLPFGIACWVFTYAPLFNFIITLPKQMQFFLTVLFIPILLAAVQSVVTVQKTDHAITTLDKFDDLLERILGKIKFNDNKIVVFVDDLDRVTPEMARDVLDNLRTFFDKKDITFVVTGDHTVLEGHLGRSLIPHEESSAAQLEEGRRFMKKIFNVYWRLPLPIKKELQDFINGEFVKRTEALNAVFPQESHRTMFSSYLEKYFESNFRQIIRFLDIILFNFQIIKQKAESEDVQQVSYFKDMLSSPLLVVRMLMIQELCAPLFDKMARDVSILQGLEYAVEKKNTSSVKQIIDQSDGVLSPNQRAFIEKFVYEEPRFYKDSRLQVLNLQPYLSLAADVSFGDQRGPSGEDFVVTLNGGDPKGVKNDLISMGDIKAEESAKATIFQLSTITDVPQKMAIMKTLVTALSDSPAESTFQKIFADKLSETDYSFVNDSAVAQKMEVINPFWQWLDLVKNQDAENKFQDKFILRDMAEFNALDLNAPAEFKSHMVAKWLRDQYPIQKVEAIGAMITHFPKLKIERVREQLDTISASFITDLVQDSNSQLRENRFVLLKDYTTSGVVDLKTNVLNKVQDFDQAITPWVIAKANEENPLWTNDEIEEKILNKIESSSDFNALNQSLRFAIANNIGSPEAIWPKLIPQHQEVIIENLPTIIDDASLQIIAPPQAYANQLMDAAIEKIKDTPEADQSRWLGYIVKGKWLWVNMQKYPIASKFRALKKSKDTAIKQALETVEESWKEKES